MSDWLMMNTYFWEKETAVRLKEQNLNKCFFYFTKINSLMFCRQGNKRQSAFKLSFIKKHAFTNKLCVAYMFFNNMKYLWLEITICNDERCISICTVDVEMKDGVLWWKYFCRKKYLRQFILGEFYEKCVIGRNI